MNTKHTYLQFISFSRFFRWDVKAYAFQHKEFDNAVLLQDILTPYDEPLSKAEMIEKGWSIISKINFSGKLFLRKPEETKSFKGSLHIVDGDTLIYSKINVRHGCVYYHPNGATPFGVSSEYPTYKIDKKRVNGEFLVLLLQSQYFKDALSARTSGISKARVKPSVFLTVEIPLPSIEEQNKIVAAYNDSFDLAEQYDEQADEKEGSIQQYIEAQLGIEQLTSYKLKQDSILQFIKFKDTLLRWDPWKGDNIISSKYKIVRLQELIQQINTGTTPPTNKPEYFGGDIKFYTPSDIDGTMYLGESERTLSQKAVIDKKARIFQKGDLLFVGIGSTVGKVGVVNDDIVSSNQQITGLTLDAQTILPEYAFVYMNANKNITTAEQSKTTLPIVNQEKIKNIQIPLPPMDVQNEIVAQVSEFKEQIKSLRALAADTRAAAIQQFEQTIFE